MLLAAMSEGDVQLVDEHVGVKRREEHELTVADSALDIAGDARVTTVWVREEQRERAERTTPLDASSKSTMEAVTEDATVVMPSDGGDVGMGGEQLGRHAQLVEVREDGEGFGGVAVRR